MANRTRREPDGLKKKAWCILGLTLGVLTGIGFYSVISSVFGVDSSEFFALCGVGGFAWALLLMMKRKREGGE